MNRILTGCLSEAENLVILFFDVVTGMPSRKSHLLPAAVSSLESVTASFGSKVEVWLAPRADLSGADLLKAWPSMGQQLGAVHSLSVDQCPFERRLSRMFGRAVDVVSRNAVNPDFLPDEDKSTPQLDLLARVERELPVRLDQERTDMVVCHGDPCMPNFMVDPKTLQCTGLIDLGRLGTADRYADLALMIANAEENWAAPDEAERAFAVLFNVLGIEAPDRERLAFYLRLDPLTWG